MTLKRFANGIKLSSKNAVFEIYSEFVYVIGLHAVQFGNNWMKKIPRTAKIGKKLFTYMCTC